VGFKPFHSAFCHGRIMSTQTSRCRNGRFGDVTYINKLFLVDGEAQRHLNELPGDLAKQIGNSVKVREGKRLCARLAQLLLDTIEAYLGDDVAGVYFRSICLYANVIHQPRNTTRLYAP
jgi:hypothetical protein